MARVIRLVSFWSFLVLAALLALQAFPYTGIFLMLFGAAMISGLLVHVFLISLAVEAVVHRIPRLFLLVPLAVYGAYYVVYAQQTIEISRKSAELRTSNPGKVLDFDANSYALVTAEANSLTQYYAIPVAYEANKNFQPEGHLSFRLIRRDQCKIPKDSQARIQTFGMHLNNRFQQGVCVLRFPEAPQGKIVTAVRSGDNEVWRHKWPISGQATTITLDGKVLGVYRSASVWRLPPFPVGFIGCALISSTPAWKCGADFSRTHIVLDTVPAGVDRSLYDTPLSVMLGLKKYTEADLANFRGYAINDAALKRVAAEPKRIEDDVFKALEALLDGQLPKPPFNMGYSLAQNPERLVPYADRMATRFVALSGFRGGIERDYARSLAAALASLPRPAFLSVADRVLDVMRGDKAWDRFPALYVRTGDAGAKALDLYKADFMTDKLAPFLRGLPAMAICRIGQADDETIAEMKRRFTDPATDEDTKSALLVALIKLGQQSYLRENLPSQPERLRTWSIAVLDNKGTTEVGPNNCMAERWNNTDYQGPMLAPALRWQRGGWTAEARTN